MNLYIAQQQLTQSAEPSLITFDADPTGRPRSLLLQSSHEEEVQLELPIRVEAPFEQDPLITEALRLFQAEVA